MKSTTYCSVKPIRNLIEIRSLGYETYKQTRCIDEDIILSTLFNERIVVVIKTTDYLTP